MHTVPLGVTHYTHGLFSFKVTYAQSVGAIYSLLPPTKALDTSVLGQQDITNWPLVLFLPNHCICLLLKNCTDYRLTDAKVESFFFRRKRCGIISSLITLEPIMIQTCSASQNDRLNFSFVKDIKVVVKKMTRNRRKMATYLTAQKHAVLIVQVRF